MQRHTYQCGSNGLVNLVVCLNEVLHHHCCTGHLLEGPVLLAQVLLPNGVVHRVVGSKVVAVGATCVQGRRVQKLQDLVHIQGSD